MKKHVGQTWEQWKNIATDHNNDTVKLKNRVLHSDSFAHNFVKHFKVNDVIRDKDVRNIT